jgi:alkaline phosphatase
MEIPIKWLSLRRSGHSFCPFDITDQHSLMKLRNHLLALFCLLVFIFGGVLYFRAWVVQKPFGIILFVCDGMTTNSVVAARLYSGGAVQRLALERFPQMALLTNYSNDFAVPDSPAAATALATGQKVNNRSLSIDPQGKRLVSILESAKAQGRAVGLVTNGNLTDAGVAAFYAHAADGNDADAVAAQFVDQAQVDVALGGGAALFLPEAKNGRRKDGRDLLMEMKQNHSVTVIHSKADLENASTFRTTPLVGLFSDDNLAFSNDPDAASGQPSLSDMVRRAIQMMQFNQNGYLLVVDVELPTRAAEQNQSERAITETVEFDHALTTALRYAGEKALVLATGKHSTGGLNLNGYPLRDDRGVGLLGTNPFGYPSVSWASGPNGPHPEALPLDGATKASGSPSPAPANSEPAAFYAPSAINVADDMIAVGTGPGSQDLHGFLDNTIIYRIIKKNL